MGWSEKYKKSIDCNNPKGFSQKAHCAGKKKNEEMVFEEITEDILNEKLITYGNRKPYGQVVFMAGGAGSGKGFAIKNFVDSSSFKIRDVDEMKKQLQILNRLGKLDIRSILKKYGRNIKLKDLDLIRKIEKDGYKLQNFNLKNPDHVYALHILVKAMGVKDNTLEKLLLGKNNPETLPNILFDITAKDITDITKVIPKLKAVGYKPENIHLTWVLTNYVTAMVNNKNRARMVPEDILLKTHEGAANTIWGIVTKALPKGMNGRVDVILNNPEHTVFFTDKDGRTINGNVKGFLSLPLKKEKGGIYAEKVWKDKLFRWVKGNAPDSITANMEESVNEINEAKEPEVISHLRDIVKKKQNKKIKDPISGKMMRVDLYSASAVTQVYDAINKSNKSKFEKLSLPKMVNVAFSVMKNESITEKMDLNDPILVRLRAASIQKAEKDKLAKIRVAQMKKNEKAARKIAQNNAKIKALKMKRADIMRDMEQEAEAEGGPIANKYGTMLNNIDDKIIKLGGNPMGESVNEAKIKKVNKSKWNRMKFDDKVTALLSVVKDPDDAEEYAESNWEDLPSGFERDMVIYESVNEGMFGSIDQIRQDSKDVRDFVKNVFADKSFKDMKNDKDFVKYLKSIYEGFASDAQRKAAFANGYEEKGKKKKNEEITIEERINLFVEKNVPTKPSKWAYYKAQAKKKFDVYPSAYANGWAAKKYKAAGGGWRKEK